MGDFTAFQDVGQNNAQSVHEYYSSVITDTFNTMFLNLNIFLHKIAVKKKKLQPFFCNYKLISASKNRNKGSEN